MSRSGYSEDCQYLNLYRQTVKKTIQGKKGQKFLKELAEILDNMSEKVLIRGKLINKNEQVCAIGSVCKQRGLDVSNIDYDDGPDKVAKLLGITWSLAAEIIYENDEGAWQETPTERWIRVRKWVQGNIK